MTKKGRKKKHEDHIDESWLVPYADILTLLLALFIVLFASSSLDQSKMDQMSSVFSEIFTSGSGVMDNPAVVLNPDANSEEVNKAVVEYLQDQAELQEIQGNVEEFIGVNELEDQFETILTDEGLLITIRDSILFDPGRADIKQEYIPIAEELSEILEFDPPRNIKVSGHTDNIPMNTREFPTNFHLAFGRASNFMLMLIDSNPNLDQSYFSAQSYGETKPIAPNNTVEGRAKNRRVEVLVQALVPKQETNEVVDN